MDKNNQRFLPLLFVLFAPLAHSTLIELDVDDVAILPIDGVIAGHVWDLTDAVGITQLEPGGSYSFDIEFRDDQTQVDQTFEIASLASGLEFINLSFFNGNGDAITDPGLVLSTATWEFTGVIGDLLISNPTSPDNFVFTGNIPTAANADAITVQMFSDLTTEGFSFHDLHIEFTLQDTANDQTFPFQLVSLVTVGYVDVPEPDTISLFGLSLIALAWIRRKKA